MSDIKKQWKAHQFDWETMAEQAVDQNYYVCLNQREMAMILGALTPTEWRTRWINLPTSEDLQWIVELKAKLLCSEGCCDGVEDCIRNNGGVREAIIEIIKEFQFGDPDRPLGGGNPVFDGCNPDVIFGAVTSLVDYLNLQIVDALEIIEVNTNPLESLNLWYDNAAIIGALPSGLIEAIDWITESIMENYVANYTLTLRDTYRCDLFCLWYGSENCELTPRMVTDYFAGRLSAPSTIDLLLDVIEFLVTGIWAGSQIVDTMHLLSMASLTMADAIGFFGIKTAYSFDVALALGANSPDPDWSILCEECAPDTWCYLLDFEVSDYGFSSVRGFWTSGIGWQAEPYGSDDCGVYLIRSFPDAVIDHVELTYDLVSGNNTRRVNMWLLDGGAVTNIISQAPAEDGEPVIKVWDGEESADEMQISLDASLNGSCTGKSATIKSILLKGSGTNPFGVDNCPPPPE